MWYTWRQISWRVIRRRLVALLALVSYLAIAVGFPVPALPAKTGGAPFPCQNHLCGCRSAEECWHHCCCYAPQERLRWAEEHHVRPPAVEGWRTPRLRDLAECRASADAACPCCTGKETARARATSAQPVTSQVGAIAALSCRGLASLWVSTGSVLPPPVPLTWSPHLVPIGWLDSLDPTAPGFVSPPPHRPPRGA
jgi:hypothetical protein